MSFSSHSYRPIFHLTPVASSHPKWTLFLFHSTGLLIATSNQLKPSSRDIIALCLLSRVFCRRPIEFVIWASLRKSPAFLSVCSTFLLRFRRLQNPFSCSWRWGTSPGIFKPEAPREQGPCQLSSAKDPG